MGFNQFNPCLCCHSEVGVYVLFYFQQLFMTGQLVMTGALGFTTLPLLSYPDSVQPVYRKATLLSIFVAFVIYPCIEVGLHEYLHKALNLSRNIKLQRCRRWVALKSVMYLLAIPIASTHLWVDLSTFKIVLYSTAFVHQAYYIWVVHHFTVEIREEIKIAEAKLEEAEAKKEEEAALSRIMSIKHQRFSTAV